MTASKVTQGLKVEAENQSPLLGSLALLCVAAVAALHISARSEIIPIVLASLRFLNE